MNKEILKEKLVIEKIPNDLYSLEGGLPNEAYCLDGQNDAWQVYYSERGIKSNLKHFNKEEDACQYIYDSLVKIYSRF